MWFITPKHGYMSCAVRKRSLYHIYVLARCHWFLIGGIPPDRKVHVCTLILGFTNYIWPKKKDLFHRKQLIYSQTWGEGGSLNLSETEKELRQCSSLNWFYVEHSDIRIIRNDYNLDQHQTENRCFCHR